MIMAGMHQPDKASDWDASAAAAPGPRRGPGPMTVTPVPARLSGNSLIYLRALPDRAIGLGARSHQ